MPKSDQVPELRKRKSVLLSGNGQHGGAGVVGRRQNDAAVKTDLIPDLRTQRARQNPGCFGSEKKTARQAETADKVIIPIPRPRVEELMWYSRSYTPPRYFPSEDSADSRES